MVLTKLGNIPNKTKPFAVFLSKHMHFADLLNYTIQLEDFANIFCKSYEINNIFPDLRLSTTQLQ